MHVSGAGIAVIAVVCIGFLVFLIVLGVARIRSTQGRTVEVNMEERQEMEWDNSALNITVNPLDHEVPIPSRPVVYASVTATIRLLPLEPRAGSGVVRMDPLRFLAGCRTRRLNQA